MITYSGIHAKLRREHGPASTWTCECGDLAAQWAYLHGDPHEQVNAFGIKFSSDPTYYRAMCRRCHAIFDRSVITQCPQGHDYTEENTLVDAGKRKCKTCHYARNRKRKPTPEQQARRTELQRARRAQRTPEQVTEDRERHTACQRALRAVAGNGS